MTQRRNGAKISAGAGGARKANISGAWRQRRQHLKSVMAGERKSALRISVWRNQWLSAKKRRESVKASKYHQRIINNGEKIMAQKRRGHSENRTALAWRRKQLAYGINNGVSGE
jgi:hypothetical protein